VLAGGNGAGKTTYFEHFIAPQGLPFINADILARNLYSENAAPNLTLCVVANYRF